MRSVRQCARAAAVRWVLGAALLAAPFVALVGALPEPAAAAPAAADASPAADTSPAGDASPAADALPAAPSDAGTPAAVAGRTVLQRVDVSGAPGMEVVTSRVELRPGEWLPRHVHHGVETAYVLQGATIQAPGQAPRVLAAGSTLVHLRGVPHGGFTVVGDTPLKLLTTHVVDKGKQLYDAAPAEARFDPASGAGHDAPPAARRNPGPDATR